MRRIAATLGIALFSALVVSPLVPPAAHAAGGLALQLFNLGCHVGQSSINGCAITSARSPLAHGDTPGVGTREGRACGWNILTLFAWGDLRITTAMENGAITEVTSVDTYAFELIPGFYGINHYCTVVSGN
jgi:hypothetical protein